jgi:hypothetical protein
VKKRRLRPNIQASLQPPYQRRQEVDLTTKFLESSFPRTCLSSQSCSPQQTYPFKIL